MCESVLKWMAQSTDNESFSVDSVIRGHHVYKSTWTPTVGQVLDVNAEPNNVHDSHAVATFQGGVVVGHLPIEFSGIAWHFLQHGGQMSCVVTGHRKYSDVPTKGLEVPCSYKFIGKPLLIKKLVKIMTKLGD